MSITAPPDRPTTERPSAPSAPATTPAPSVAELAEGWDHLEFWVGNARAFSHLLVGGFGFEYLAYRGPETGTRDRVSYLLAQGSVRVVVTAGLGPGSEVVGHVGRHGDGVRTVALAVHDVAGALASARAGGAAVVEDPAEVADEDGVVGRSAVATYGETALAFVDRSGYRGCFEPGFDPAAVPAPHRGAPVGLASIDHLVANVEEGALDRWVDFHRDALGFAELQHFDADQISTEFSALRSTVVHNGRGVTMPINEPAPGRRKSQIQEYLEEYGAAGIQHIALATSDIVATVDELSARGVRFLVPPPAYYEDARRRTGGLALPWEDLERLGILVDMDRGGHLLQVFTETLSDRPTVFVEVIERRGAEGFGEGNFKALFEAIEREQARRGNL